MSERLARKVRRANLTERLFSAERALHDQGVYTAIDQAGRPVKEVFRPILPPYVTTWLPADTGWQPIPRPGRAMLILVHATGAPTTGTATFNVTWESAGSGETLLSNVYLTVGERFGQEQVLDPDTGNIGVDLPAGAWVYRNIVDAQGATGITISLITEPR